MYSYSPSARYARSHNSRDASFRPPLNLKRRSVVILLAFTGVVLVAGCGGAGTRGVVGSSSDAVKRSSLGHKLDNALADRPGLSDYDGDDNGDGRRDRDDDDTQGPKDRDGDRDGSGDSYVDGDERSEVPGAAAKPGDARLIEALVKSYFRAAVAGDGRTICGLLVPAVARQMPLESGLPIYARGESCSSAMSKLFGANHDQVELEVRALEGIHPRLTGTRGWALLAFRGISTRKLAVQRQGGVWRLATIDQPVL